jgi:Family of unknown function (DUF6364)
MPLSKLTLSVDKLLVKRAKKLATARRTSVSAMVSRFLSGMTEPDLNQTPVGPLTRRATGLAKGIPNRPVGDLLAEALSTKHRVSKM